MISVIYCSQQPLMFLVGNIIEDSIGQNANKKIPKRRINMIEGNISSYSRMLNNQKSLDYIAEANRKGDCKGCCKGEEGTGTKIKGRKEG